MSGTNDFKSLATGVGANVLTQAEYEALASLLANGFTSGVADSKTINKVLRQSSFVAEAIAKIIADNNVNALDDGDVATFKANLLAAILGSVTTPPQFDNDTSLATTAFVQRALGNMQGVSQPAANTTLTSADVGKLVSPAASGLTITLPVTSAVSAGSRIEFFAGLPVTVATQGGDTIWPNGSSIGTSITLGVGDSAVFEKQSNGVWLLIAGAAQAKYAAAFGSSPAANGYQKLPSGLIIQWGGGTPSGAGNYQVALPIAFPTLQLKAFATTQGEANPSLCVSVFSLTQTAIDVRVRTLAGAASTQPVAWFAIGH